MVYFYDPVDVEQDQVIDGSVTLTQSKENARFMNIHLEYALCFMSSRSMAPLHGFAFWFDVEFSGPANSDEPASVEPPKSHRRKRAHPDEALVLSTAPEDPPTHWQQVHCVVTGVKVGGLGILWSLDF
uniref:Probable protein arginine N-methyltransferase 6 isoform X1 n=1 Tax=Tanacetum cinerariifolium TaxID=118510 RepID=A0A699HFN0_TANCI|nr:probable protein arginine N-methyltransferase 6 isoform X1 [Tanacetum cinerariifolium]